ncbi:MAG: hypothetical protein JWN30_761 [Bacilli bacterium]|nr:hypothetical protein [Bacilli bacterium]
MKKIVILGAGYAGMICAVNLQKRHMPFTLINKHSYHYFTTILHEPAGGRNDFDDYSVDITYLLDSPTSTFSKEEVVEIRPHDNKVVSKSGEILYDLLVVALGNAPEYFGIAGLAENSLLLRSLESAKTIRKHIEDQIKLYKEDHNPAHLKIVVGGAGLTGIELCGELSEWIPQLRSNYHILEEVDIINLEAAPMILPMLDAALQEQARDVLTKKGVQLRTSEKIVRVNPGEVELASGEKVEASTIIWTGGVRANPLVAAAGFTCDPRGRAKVNEYFQAEGFDNVFVLGDSACLLGADGKPYPPTAQLAQQMGEHCAKNITGLVLSDHPLKPFVFHYMGTLASLGSEVGVGNVKGIKTRGVPANLLKEASKAKYLFNLGGFRLLADKRGQFTR